MKWIRGAGESEAATFRHYKGELPEPLAPRGIEKMDHEIQAEITRLHERANRMGERVTVLETTVPHIASDVNQIKSDIRRATWAFILLFIAAVANFTIQGGWTKLSANAEEAPAESREFKP